MFNIAVLLLIFWLLCVFAFEITSPLVHLLLIAAVVTLVMGLLRRRRR